MVIIRAEKTDISVVHLLKGSRVHIKALYTQHKTNKYMHFASMRKKWRNQSTEQLNNYIMDGVREKLQLLTRHGGNLQNQIPTLKNLIKNRGVSWKMTVSSGNQVHKPISRKFSICDQNEVGKSH